MMKELGRMEKSEEERTGCYSDAWGWVPAVSDS